MWQSKPYFTMTLSLILCGVFLGWGSLAFAESGNEVNGKKLYLTYCFLCHGPSGQGDGFAASVQPSKPRNLADDAYMSTRSDQQLFDAISGGGPAIHGSMTMPYWRESLTEAEIRDLVAYVRTLHRKPPFTGDASRGADIYANYCWTCHGKSGKGDGPIAAAYQPQPRDLTNQSYVAGLTDYDLYHVISQGGAVMGRSAAMPGWGHVLTPQDMWDLVAYIRQLAK
jgi:cytochrome c oxidase cbb3-type subunit 3